MPVRERVEERSKWALKASTLLLFLVVRSFAQQATGKLDLTTIGYKALSSMARRSDKVNLTIDFVDSDHLLITYNPKVMFHRLPDCPPSHDDRLMEAAIAEISTGKVLNRATWYLHDGRPFLWPFGSQKFLLRRLNNLYILDSTLHEKLAFASPVDLRWVSVTPDGRQVIDEIADSTSQLKTGTSVPKVRLEFRDSESFAVQRVVKLDREVPLEATDSGFASVIAGFSGKVWLVRFGPTQRQRESIARVRTHRVPDVLYLNSNTLLIGRDSATIPGYSVSAFSVGGERLWRKHWDDHRYSPVVQRSEDGSRFAISTLRPGSAPEPQESSSSEPSEAVIQSIQVFNTVTGELLFATEANPVFATGRNFALSPNGDRLAVIDGTTVQFYDLRPMSSEERAKYVASRAEPVAPTLIPDAQTANAEEEHPTAASHAAEEASEPTKAAESNAQSVAQTAANSASEIRSSSSVASADAVPTFKSRRQIVALDVVVTDSAGRIIKSLPRDSFQVKEDGKPQAISNFSEVVELPPRTANLTPVSVAPKKSPNLFSSDSQVEVGGGVVVILYDLLNTPASAQQNAKSALISFIQHKPKNARFALCALSEGLSMLQGFTPDEGLLARAVKNDKGSLRFTAMKGEDANDQMLVSWLQAGVGKAPASLGAANGSQGASMLLDTAAKQEQDEVQRHSRDLELRMAVTMDAFTQLARYLAALPGRKSVIWLSGSFPLAIFPGMDFRNPYSDNSNNSGQMKQTVNLLAESHVAVYPVDVRGLTAASADDSSFDPPQPAQFSQTSDTKRFDELANLNAPGAIGSTGAGNNSPYAEEVIEHGLMKQIADDTGGKAFYNGNGLEQAMTNVMEQQSNYYELSYTPTNKKYDGKFRRIKVTLAGDKRLHVIHRSGYFAVDPDASIVGSRDAGRGFGLAAMQAGAPQARQLVFQVRAAPMGKTALAPDPKPVASGKRKKGRTDAPKLPRLIEMQRYALDYEVLSSQINFEQTPDGLQHGELNFMVASFASDGSVQTSIGSHAKVDLSPSAYQDVLTSGLQMHQEVDVPVAASLLRVGVQDTTTGRMGTLEINLAVPALPGIELSHKRRLPEIEPD